MMGGMGGMGGGMGGWYGGGMGGGMGGMMSVPVTDSAGSGAAGRRARSKKKQVNEALLGPRPKSSRSSQGQPGATPAGPASSRKTAATMTTRSSLPEEERPDRQGPWPEAGSGRRGSR